MKVLQLAGLFVGAVSAVNTLVVRNALSLNGRLCCSIGFVVAFECIPSNTLVDVRRDMDATTTAVIFVTSYDVYTTLCSNAKECPPSATVVVTSTTVMASTTTICSTPGAVLPPLGAPSLPISTPVSSTALPTTPGSPSTTTPGLPVGPSGTAGSSVATSVVSQSPGPAVSASFIPSSSVESTVSIVSPTPSVSGYLPHGVSSATPPSGSTLRGPSFNPITGTTPVPSVPGSSGSIASSPVSSPTASSNTEATHTSFPATPSSGGYHFPSSSPGLSSNTASDAAPNSSAGPSSPAGLSSSVRATLSGTFPSSLSYSVGSPSGPSASGPSASTGPSYALSSAYAISSASGPYESAVPSASGSPSGSGPYSSAGTHSSSIPDAVSTTEQVPLGTTPGYASSVAPGSITSASRPTLRSTTSGGYGPPTPPAESEYPANSTVRVTSYYTQTLTSFITSPMPSSVPNSTHTASDIEATDIRHGTSASAFPSRSGYAFPSGGLNGSVVSPQPTYSEVPINMGLVVGAGRSSLAAIVVALAFAHIA